MKELRIDNVLDDNLRPMKIDTISAPIELATDKVRITEDARFTKDLIIEGDLFIEGNTGDINMTDGVQIESTATAGFVSLTSMGLIVNATSYSGEDGDEGDNDALLALIPSENYDAKIQLFSAGGLIEWTIGNDGSDSDKFKFDAGNAVVGGATKLTLEDDGDLITTGDVTLAATKKLYLDGGGDTYIVESSTNVMRFFCNDSAIVQLESETQSINGTLKIKEQADANADTAAYGQIWVDTATPNELAFTDDAGTDIIGIGKYHYESKMANYTTVATGNFIPLSGGTVERTSTAGQNEYIAMVAPYNGTIEKILWRSEESQDGTMEMDIYESADETEVPGTITGTKDTVLDRENDDITFDVSFASMTSGVNTLTKGRIYAIKITTPSAPGDTNTTVVFKWDVTS